MKAAVIGSRSLSVPDLENYLPEDTTEIISGGAKGVACGTYFNRNIAAPVLSHHSIPYIPHRAG